MFPTPPKFLRHFQKLFRQLLCCPENTIFDTARIYPCSKPHIAFLNAVVSAATNIF
ncbi:MAG: hypothetical protein AVDCRST_MAG95-2042 [uncultured Adhaeribacter sp.]|uniref:Uncharacterized protein n=1 Tax=uncultured Adhaeribacter sp. TaxID=448109 RepID=A0A6J4IN31_9BACT|nr:MAG: hypothetical protein AVDCRST_MAG95-2042 [uncultured Adhaeribacter sp.]